MTLRRLVVDPAGAVSAGIATSSDHMDRFVVDVDLHGLVTRAWLEGWGPTAELEQAFEFSVADTDSFGADRDLDHLGAGDLLGLAAPDLADVETVAVLRKRWLAKSLTARRFRSAITALGDIAIIRYPTLPLMARAYELRANITAYDAPYVALAEVLECPLLTGDRRLAGAPGPRCDLQLVAVD